MEPNRRDLTKEHLQRYPFYKSTIKRKKEQNEELDTKLEGINGIDYSKDKVSGTPLGDLTITLLAEKMKNEEIIRVLENRCKDIDAGLELLSEVEKKVLTLYYITGPIHKNKKTWISIAFEVNYSDRQCKNIRDDGVHKLVDYLVLSGLVP